MNTIKRNIIIWTLRIILSGLFLFFSFSKLFPANSATVTSNSKAFANDALFAKSIEIKKDTGNQSGEKNNSVFAKYSKFSTGAVDLDSGKVIVCLFSLDCDHCQETNKILNELKKKHLNI